MEFVLGLTEFLLASVGSVSRAIHLNSPHKIQQEREKPMLDSNM